MATTSNLCVPDPLRVLGSNMADDWQRFREQYDNYEMAADLTHKSQEKRDAVFLTCIGNDAYDIYCTMEFESGTIASDLIQWLRRLGSFEHDDVLVFWRMHASEFKELLTVARNVLSVSASSVPVECMFSSTGLILNSKRATLSPSTLNYTCFIHNNTARR